MILTLAEIVRFAREARAPAGNTNAFLGVSGILARELASELAAGGRPGIVQVGVDNGAAAHVRVLGGAPTVEDSAVLRDACRQGTLVVLVQAGLSEEPNPYVPEHRVVKARPGQRFPVEEICQAIVNDLPSDALGLAALLPVMCPAARATVVKRTAARAAGVAAWSRGSGPDLPRLSLLQARMLVELRRLQTPGAGVARAETTAATVAAELVLPLLAGLSGRLVTRKLRAGPLARAAVAAGTCLALGAASPRFAALNRLL